MPLHLLNDDDVDAKLAEMYSIDRAFDDLDLTAEDVADMIDELRDKFERRGVDL